MDKIEEVGYDLDSIIKDRVLLKQTHLDLQSGWYQSSKGLLFHYDGLIWDQVPDSELASLEYLG